MFDSTQLINKEGEQEFSTMALNESNSCNVDMASYANHWGDQANGVALILYDQNTYTCSGCLVNNTRQDRRPFFLTAFHCFNLNENNTMDSNEITLAQQAVFRFHYKKVTAGGSELRPTVTFNNSTYRAGWASTDFALLELTAPVSSFNRFTFLGWDSRNVTPPTGSVYIHHPQGDVMKFSLSHDTPQLNSSTISFAGPDGPPNSHWTQDFISTGGLEPGSSGAPVMKGANQGRFIIGQVHGIQGMACNLTGIANGALHVSWTGGGTSTTRLSNWLNPIDQARRELASLCLAPPAPSFPYLGVAVMGTSLYANVVGAENGYEYEWEVIRRSGCCSASIVWWSTATTANNKVTIPLGGQPASSYYYIRSRAKNSCGTGPWSGYVQFSYNPPFSLSASSRQTQDAMVEMYPNPAQDYLTIELNDLDSIVSDQMTMKYSISDSYQQISNESISVEILDQNQILVTQVASRKGRIYLDTRTYPRGKYFIHIHHKGAIIRKQLIIE